MTVILTNSLTLPPHIKDKPWISRKNHDKDTHFIMKNNRKLLGLKVRVGVRFFFYSELATHWPVMTHAPDFTWTEKIWAGNVRWTPTMASLKGGFTVWRQSQKEDFLSLIY